MFVSIAPSGVTSLTVVPSGSLSRFVTLSVKSTFPPFSTSSFSTVGSYLSASVGAGVVSLIVTGTVNLSVLPSGYVTVTATSVVPTVFPSGNLLGSSTVTFGVCPGNFGFSLKSGTFTASVTSFSVTAVPLSFSTGSAVGVYLSASCSVFSFITSGTKSL